MNFKPCVAILLTIALLLQFENMTAQCTCEDPPENINVIWTKKIDVAYDDVGWNFTPIDDGDSDNIADDGIIVVGSVNSDVNGGNNGMDIYIARLNAAGTTIIWDETWDGGMSPAKQDAAYSVIQTTTGAIIICGSTATNYFGSGINRNAWVGKMDVDGNWISGWPKQYGSTGDDIAFDVAEDLSGNYVLAGTASASGNDLGTQTVNSDGDYWVFKIGTTGYLNTSYSKVYFGNNSLGGNDYAKSIAVDCSTGHYIVAGFCKSCAPSTDDHSQLYLLKIATNFGSYVDENYGYIDEFDDFGANAVIQYNETFGECASSPDPLDGFLTLGIQHPRPGCFLNQHDFWLVKTDNDLLDQSLSGACVDANTGAAYGGKKRDNGHDLVQTCGGLLLAGGTKSNNLDESCTNCQVECNHYDCDDDETEDIWLAMVNSSTGEYLWEESLGEGGDDGAYSIKRVHDGAYILAGYFTNEYDETDFYIIKFEIVTTCTAPVVNSPSVSTYCATLSWTMDPCVPYYDLRWKEGNGSWQLVSGVTSPYVLTNPTDNGINTFSWEVRARCTPGYWSSYTAGTGVTISYCGATPVNCTSCTKLENENLEEGEKKLVTVFPNPSSGFFTVSLALQDQINEVATIEILDQSEKIVSTYSSLIQEGKLNYQINSIGFHAGLYLARVKVQGKSYTAKVAIQ